MPYTAPNQKVLQIHRAPLSGSFLGINNDNWKYAARVLGAQAFLLYIYLASNKDDYKFALSPKAIQQEIGMPPSTYRDQLHKLESMGFLIPGKGNLIHFYEVPQRATHSESTDGALNSSIEKNATAVDLSTVHAHEGTPKDIEIYINDKKESTNIPKVREENPSVRTSNSYYKNQFHF